MEESGRHLLNHNETVHLRFHLENFMLFKNVCDMSRSLIKMTGGQKRQIIFLKMYTESMDFT